MYILTVDLFGYIYMFVHSGYGNEYSGIQSINENNFVLIPTSLCKAL